jgi:hypothetical protein
VDLVPSKSKKKRVKSVLASKFTSSVLQTGRLQARGSSYLLRGLSAREMKCAETFRSRGSFLEMAMLRQELDCGDFGEGSTELRAFVIVMCFG